MSGVGGIRSGAARLSRIVLMVRGSEGIARAVNFYHQALGLQVHRVTDDWAELGSSSSGSDITLSLQAVHSNEAQLSTGYSPWITFEVDEMDPTVAAAVQAGAHLDGPIQYPAHGKVAMLRSPDNHMIGLYEPAVQRSNTDDATTTASSSSNPRRKNK